MEPDRLEWWAAGFIQFTIAGAVVVLLVQHWSVGVAVSAIAATLSIALGLLVAATVTRRDRAPEPEVSRL